MDKNRTNYEGGADLLDDGAVKNWEKLPCRQSELKAI